MTGVGATDLEMAMKGSLPEGTVKERPPARRQRHEPREGPGEEHSRQKEK